MTADNTALLKWSENEKRYELYIDDVLKYYSLAADGADDTQEGHKGGFDDLCTIAKENGYKVIVEPYKADAEKTDGEK